MTVHRSVTLSTIATALVLMTGAASSQQTGTPPADPTGQWLVAKRVATIRIVNCNGEYWGVVAWEKTPGVDSKNPDPAKRARPTLGMPVLLGMKPSKPGEWSGDIYNSNDGKTYSASIILRSPNVLQVKGCVLGFLCGGEDWTRAEEPAAATAPSRAEAPAKSTAPSRADKSASKSAAPAPDGDEQVCQSLGLAAPAGLPGSTHERRLK